jgi:type II secretory pathway component PulF
MAVFRYTALNQAGKQISGEMEAKSRELVIRHLAEAGMSTMALDGLRKCVAGRIAADEARRMTLEG